MIDRIFSLYGRRINSLYNYSKTKGGRRETLNNLKEEKLTKNVKVVYALPKVLEKIEENSDKRMGLTVEGVKHVQSFHTGLLLVIMGGLLKVILDNLKREEKSCQREHVIFPYSNIAEQQPPYLPNKFVMNSKAKVDAEDDFGRVDNATQSPEEISESYMD